VRFNKGDANATAHVGSRPSCARASAQVYRWLGNDGELHGGMPGRMPDWGCRQDMPRHRHDRKFGLRLGCTACARVQGSTRRGTGRRHSYAQTLVYEITCV
jgi:hypothetical protein